MIHVYDNGNQEYSRNGNAVIEPLSGTVRMVAGGNYELQAVCAMDDEGKWMHMIEEAVIKAPIPEETIENAFTGLEADVYVTTEAAALRSGPNEPTTINYPAWVEAGDYSVGSKVTFGNKNYQCVQYDRTDIKAHVIPSASDWWVQIARTTPGDPLLVNTKQGTELYYISGPTNNWYKMSTTYGLEGYIKSSQVEYSHHLTPAETKPKKINEQLFRIKTVSVDTDAKKVTVNARHVSYDLNGIQIDNVKIVRKPPAEALAWIEQAFMIPYRGIIATNMPTNDDATYSAEISGKSGMYAILDPDKGVVPCFGAEFRRDNWDLFVMAPTNTDRGFRIRYGNNMRGIQWKRNTEKLVTRIVPVAKAEDGSDLYLDPVKWVDSSHINEYETVYMDRIKVNGQVGKDDGTETDTKWTAATLRTEMEAQAQSRYDVDHVDEPVHEITVDFVMLGETAEYPWLKDLQSVILYDTVIAIDERSGLSVSVTVEELEYDIVKKRVTALKLTNIKAYNVRNVSGFNVVDNSITGDKLTDEAGDALMSQAVDEAAEYTNTKASQALSSAKNYAEENTTQQINSYDNEIKRYIQQHYQPL